MNLTIQMRKRQLKRINPLSSPVVQEDIIFTGATPVSLVATPGSVSGVWTDYTDFTIGLDKLELEWTAEVDNNGTMQVGHFATRKGVSGSLTFERTAYEFIKEHLVNDVAATLNQIEVQLTDECGNYVGYVMKASDIQWCEFNSNCIFETTLKQVEDYVNCIERTVISDNWQGWFQPAPNGGKKHPRFSYCVEQRPNWTLVILWVLTLFVASLFTIIFTVIYPILFAIYALTLGIVVIINAIIDVINAFPGGPFFDHIDPPTPPPTPGDIVDNWALIMLEAAGCGREHPAPLIRDYIVNVCDKCGVYVNADTAPMFFAPYLQLAYSDGALHNEPNSYYNACYLFPQVKRGIRRFRSINILTGSTDPDNSYYQTENAPNISLDMFLDKLSTHFNNEWHISQDALGTPYLYINRKDWYVDQPSLYDFSLGSPDRMKIVEGICYTPQEFTVPASLVNGLYQNDPSDKCGVEAKDGYDGAPLQFNETFVNQLFKGTLDKSQDNNFSPAHFNCDGSTTNYIYDALQWTYSVCTELVIVGIGSIMGIIANAVADEVKRYANYALLLQTETVSVPKILIWNGDPNNPGDPSYLNARAVKKDISIAGGVFTVGKTSRAGLIAGITMPDINTYYPSRIPAAPGSPVGIPAALAWNVVHRDKADVIGTITGGAAPPGVYQVFDTFGGVRIHAPAILVNYPMYFEPHYLETLWDKLHWVDDPMRNPKLHKKWSVKIEACCTDIELLGLNRFSNGQKLLYPCTLDTTFYNKGVITSIKLNFDSGSEDGTGQFIEISGIV